MNTDNYHFQLLQIVSKTRSIILNTLNINRRYALEIGQVNTYYNIKEDMKINNSVIYTGIAPNSVFGSLNFDVIDIRLDQLVIFLIPTPRKLTRFESMGKLLTNQAWLLFSATFLISFVAIKLIGNRSTDEHFKKFADVIYHLTALLTSTAVPKWPSTVTLRIVFVFYAFYSLVIDVVLQGR